jgi:hypothetical protein
MNQKYQSIKNKIFDVFPASAPKNGILFPEQSSDAGHECHQVKLFLQGKMWKDLSRKNAALYAGDEDAILAFLSPFGFFYYLPAFLLMCIEECDVDIYHSRSVVFYLTPTRSNRLKDRQTAEFDLFNAEQADVIVKWLEFVEIISTDKGDPLRVADAINYWSKRSLV